MDEIEEVVSEIVSGCKSHKVTVTPLLAAFVARTILEGDSVAFALEKELDDEDVNKVIEMSIARLLEKDSPSLETVKMQVGFDSSHVNYEESMRNRKERAKDKKRERHRDIISTKREFEGIGPPLSRFHILLTSTPPPNCSDPNLPLTPPISPPQLSTPTTSIL